MDTTEKQMIEDIKKAEEALSRKRKNLRNKRAKDKRAVLRKQTEDLGKELAELFGYKTRVLTEEERQEVIDQIKLGKELAERFKPKNWKEKQRHIFVKEIVKRWKHLGTNLDEIVEKIDEQEDKMRQESDARKHDEK